VTPWVYLLRQPVLVGLLAAALALFGLTALLALPLRASPIIPPRYVDINTPFPGAAAATVDRFVTLPLEAGFGALAGVRYVTGATQVNDSDVQAYIAPGADTNTVFAELLASANATRANLPSGVQPSVLQIIGDDSANQEINVAALFPPSLSAAVITAYMQQSVIPRLETVPGIGPVTLYSGSPALHVVMNGARMQAYGITPADLTQVLTNASTVAPAGALRNSAAALPVNAESGLNQLADFDALPVATRGGVTLPLSAVAQASVGFPPGTDQQWYNQGPAVYLAAGIAPDGNILEVAKGVRRVVADLTPSLPPAVQLAMVYDQSIGVAESLHDLILTLVITITLVGGITYASLGTARAALAPFLAILLSLLGAVVVMQVTGQSFNLFTIIALVLAVGLVVDDAIVVVEDIFRRTAEGETPLHAAQASITRLAPVLAAISSTLVVAFLPLGFLSGLTAALFRPFALVLISAFLFSLCVALCIVPSIAMWASRFYVHRARPSLIDRLRALYLRLLAPVLHFPVAVAVAVVAVAVCCFGLAQIAPKNLNPAPDGLDLNFFAAAPNGASLGYVVGQVPALEKVLHDTYPDLPEWIDASEQNHAIFGGYSFDTPEEAATAVTRLSAALGALPGLSTYVNQDSGLPGSDDLPVSVNVSGQTDSARLLGIANAMQDAANASGDFNFVQINPGLPQYQYALRVDRARAASLGLDASDIENAAADALAEGNLGQVNVGGTAMNLVLGLPSDASAQTLMALPVKTSSGALVPLSTVATLTGQERPSALGSWQGLPSVNIQAQQKQGVALSTALDDLHRAFVATGARDLSFGLSGPSETYQETSKQNIRLFELGLAGLFFLLAAQFQSLRDPFVVITTVPLGSLGPLLLCVLGGATLNLVTEIALLTVWGLIARQGILFVQVAHEGRDQGLPLRAAALRAARLRFRPILMITLALLGGALPLVLATGPQATIRYDLGAILATGMGGGFILSLFAVPAMYCLLHRGTHEL